MNQRRRYVLLLVSVDGQRRPSILTEILRNVVRNTLSTDEDQHLRMLLADLVEVLDELRPLLKVADDLDDLLDVVVGSELHGADVDLDEVLQEVLWSNNKHPNCPLGSAMNVHWPVFGRPWAT